MQYGQNSLRPGMQFGHFFFLACNLDAAYKKYQG
jgi:hypothetical protein